VLFPTTAFGASTGTPITPGWYSFHIRLDWMHLLLDGSSAFGSRQVIYPHAADYVGNVLTRVEIANGACYVY
jgi:hypothetical protein